MLAKSNRRTRKSSRWRHSFRSILLKVRVPLKLASHTTVTCQNWTIREGNLVKPTCILGTCVEINVPLCLLRSIIDLHWHWWKQQNAKIQDRNDYCKISIVNEFPNSVTCILCKSIESNVDIKYTVQMHTQFKIWLRQQLDKLIIP